MKKNVVCMVAACLVSSITLAGTITVAVSPQGDGMAGKDRYGYGFPWESVPFDSASATNWAGHWYDAPYGGWRDVYMQVGLSSLPTADNILSATLDIYVESVSGSSANLNHASNSNTATGNASDQIGGDTLVASIPSSASAGWMAIDVTNCIKSNLNNGNSWAAFCFVHAGYSGLNIASAESSYAPTLQVATAIPEPATLVLLGLGSLGFVRRKK